MNVQTIPPNPVQVAPPARRESLPYEQFCDTLRREYKRFRRWWRVDQPFPEATFYLECLQTPRGLIIVEVFPDGEFFLFGRNAAGGSLPNKIAWALKGNR